MLPSQTPADKKIELASFNDTSSNDAKSAQGLDLRLESQERLHVSASNVPQDVSATRTFFIIFFLSGVTFLSTVGSGLLTTALPAIAKDVDLHENLLLWPASVYALAAGCTLLIFGAVADVVGSKPVWLFGASLYILFTVACGFCRTGIQLILFRTMLGIAISMCYPTAVSITTRSFVRGKKRNVCFACMGMGQPLGYAVGLLFGGVFVDTIGWRWGYFLSAIINAAIVVGAIWGLPSEESKEISWNRLMSDIDWIGAVLISVSLGLLSYVLAMVTASYTRLSQPLNIALLTVALLLIPVFGLWMRRQERLGKPAIIPNSLWKNVPFTTVCIAVFLTWGVFNSLQFLTTLYFQRVQGLSALQASIRFLPMVITGVATNIVTGYLVDKVQVQTLAAVSAVISLMSFVLMAITKPEWSYWSTVFLAISFAPVHSDVLFTVSNLVISNCYSRDRQALAGGVFSTMSMVGNSVGLAVSAAIAASVTMHTAIGTARDNPGALLEGYHVSFWTMLGCMGFVCVVTFWGLKDGGKVGEKED